MRLGHGFPRAYGQGHADRPVATAHGQRAPVRPLPGATAPLMLSGMDGASVRPRGPMVGRDGVRLPGGVGTDPTNPATWRRAYYFPEGVPPEIRQRPRFS
jgi:hypothetical protein